MHPCAYSTTRKRDLWFARQYPPLSAGGPLPMTTRPALAPTRPSLTHNKE